MDCFREILLRLDYLGTARFAYTSKQCHSIIMTILSCEKFYIERLPIMYPDWVDRLYIQTEVSDNKMILLCAIIDELSLYHGKYEKLERGEYAICISVLIDMSKREGNTVGDNSDLFRLACLFESKYYEKMAKGWIQHNENPKATFTHDFDHKTVIRNALDQCCVENNAYVFNRLLKYTDLSGSYGKYLLSTSLSNSCDLDKDLKILKLILARPEIMPDDHNLRFAIMNSVQHHNFHVAELLLQDERFLTLELFVRVSKIEFSKEQASEDPANFLHVELIPRDLIQSISGNDRVTVKYEWDKSPLLFVTTTAGFTEEQKLRLISLFLARKIKLSHSGIKEAIVFAKNNKMSSIFNLLEIIGGS